MSDPYMRWSEFVSIYERWQQAYPKTPFLEYAKQFEPGETVEVLTKSPKDAMKWAKRRGYWDAREVAG